MGLISCEASKEALGNIDTSSLTALFCTPAIRMSFRVWFAAAAFLILCACSTTLHQALPERRLRIGFDDSPPYMVIGATGNPQGLGVELISEAARRKKIRLQWVRVERSFYHKGETRPEHLLANGRLDLWPVAGMAKERLQHFHIGRPWLQSNFFLVSRKSSSITTPSEAENKRIVHVKMPLATEMARKFLSKSHLEAAQGYSTLIGEVCRGTQDAAFLEGRTLEDMLMNLPDDCFHVRLNASAVTNAISYAGIEGRREYAEQVDALSDGISSLVSDGTYARAVDRWSSFSASETRSLATLQQAEDRSTLVQKESWGLVVACVALAIISVLMYRDRRAAERARLISASRSDVLQQLVKANERVSLAARAAGVGIWDFDIVNKHLIWDDQMFRLYGIEHEHGSEAYEMWSSSLHPDDRVRLDEEIQLAIQGITDFDTEFRVVWTDGSVHVIRALSIVQRDEAGKPLHMVGTNWDITAQRQAANDLLQSNRELAKTTAQAQVLAEEAASANAAKSEFLANMSHEIRTPMNGVIGVTELLLHTELTTQQHRYVEIVKSSGESLMTIINDILDFSKIEAGKCELDPISFHLGETMSQIERLLNVKANERALQFSCQIDTDIPLELIGDCGRLRQVLLNLAGNAIKFTERGAVRVRAERQREDATSVCIRFLVEDTGIGIPADKKALVFSAFQQVDGSITRRFGGTGLGLAICQKLVHLLGGEIGLESELGSGSRFWFTLDFQKARKGESSRESPCGEVNFLKPEAAATVSKKKQARILLAEDNDVNQLVAVGILTNLGYHVQVASDGNEALAMLGADCYDLVLMDCQMPKLNGYEATRHIRDSQTPTWNKSIPVIALTAHAMEGEKEKCFAAGMDDYLSKPIQPAELIATLHKWLQPPGCS